LKALGPDGPPLNFRSPLRHGASGNRRAGRQRRCQPQPWTVIGT